MWAVWSVLNKDGVYFIGVEVGSLKAHDCTWVPALAPPPLWITCLATQYELY